MRNTKFAYWILAVGVSSFAIAAWAYTYVFGITLSDNHSVWAEFGSYFGGLLNPILAFLAIVMLFITLMSQMAEFRASISYLDASAHVAREELELLKIQSLDNETIAVLANADQQITMLLQCDVSSPDSVPKVTIFHMCLESRRYSDGESWTGAYAQFVKTARTSGSIIWSYVHALSDVVNRVAEILRAHSLTHQGQYSPTVMYYHHRIVGLTRMLTDAGFLTEEEGLRVVTMADQHG